MVTLEKYRGPSTRHTCPSCGKRRAFVRYVTELGEYIADDVGRCNRESSCGYHYKPSEYNADNGAIYAPRVRQHRSAPARSAPVRIDPDFIERERLLDTLAGYEENNFILWLLDLFPEDAADVWDAVGRYFIGTFPDPGGAYTCFPYLDREWRFCRGKLLRYDATTGKRRKGAGDTSNLSFKLGLTNFEHKQSFFGEHLLSENPGLPVAIVEAEKTAVIASMCKRVFPDLVWLSSFSKPWLNAERLEQIGSDRSIILYPDADGFEKWQQVASEARGKGVQVRVSTLIEENTTTEEKAAGFDLADYLIRQQELINEHNGQTPGDRAIIEAERLAIAEMCSTRQDELNELDELRMAA